MMRICFHISSIASSKLMVAMPAIFVMLFSLSSTSACACEAESDFEPVQRVLTKYCAGCHNADENEGKFSVDSFQDLIAGGESGPVVTPGAAASSRLVQLVRGTIDPKMPPEGEPGPTEEEILAIEKWIEKGAMGPANEQHSLTLKTPKIDSKVAKLPVTAMAISPEKSWIAYAKYKSIEVVDQNQKIQFETTDLPGKVHDVLFTQNGRQIFVATGVTGLNGQILNFDISTGKLLRTFAGHRDICCDLDLNHDESLLASASYDRTGTIWDLATGKVKSKLIGHNGAIHKISFVPDRPLVATASDDATVKIWNLEGNRIDTRSEPLKEQYALTFDVPGQHFFSAGADNRIRKWKFVSEKSNQTNPIQIVRYGHRSPIEHLLMKPDGTAISSISQRGQLKFWNSNDLRELAAVPLGSSVSSVAFDNQTLRVGLYSGEIRVIKWPEVSSRANQSNRNTPADIAVKTTTSNEAQSYSESEPNNSIGNACEVKLPFVIKGKLDDNVDLIKFRSTKGMKTIFEIKAARIKSKLDSRIEILDSSGQRVPRVQLQAVRDSYFTFRGKNSSQAGDFRIHNWEEMKLGQFLYCEGEVVRLYHYPRGPDSGFNVFPNFGSRHTFFDTTPIAHALNEPCYIVEAYAPDAKLAPTGLPSFLLYFENDDDAERRFGTDSKLTFTAPEDGNYFVRITDSRGQMADNFNYELIGRAPNPEFNIRRLENENPKISRGTYKRIGVQFERIDGFRGPVEVTLKELRMDIHWRGPQPWKRESSNVG